MLPTRTADRGPQAATAEGPPAMLMQHFTILDVHRRCRRRRHRHRHCHSSFSRSLSLASRTPSFAVTASPHWTPSRSYAFAGPSLRHSSPGPPVHRRRSSSSSSSVTRPLDPQFVAIAHRQSSSVSLHLTSPAGCLTVGHPPSLCHITHHIYSAVLSTRCILTLAARSPDIQVSLSQSPLIHPRSGDGHGDGQPPRSTHHWDPHLSTLSNPRGGSPS
jgi:hypothetical protein